MPEDVASFTVRSVSGCAAAVAGTVADSRPTTPTARTGKRTFRTVMLRPYGRH
jgi:hypothetical protein